jgi:hypothetical protein
MELTCTSVSRDMDKLLSAHLPLQFQIRQLIQDWQSHQPELPHPIPNPISFVCCQRMPVLRITPLTFWPRHASRAGDHGAMASEGPRSMTAYAPLARSSRRVKVPDISLPFSGMLTGLLVSAESFCDAFWRSRWVSVSSSLAVGTKRPSASVARPSRTSQTFRC